MRHCLVGVLLLVCAARGEITLELTGVVTLPIMSSYATDRFDVQHWMDSESYGWVAAVNDTVLQYQTGLSDSVHTFVIPPDLHASLPEWAEYRSWAQTVRIIKPESCGADPCVLILYELRDSRPNDCTGQLVAATINVATAEVIDFRDWSGDYCWTSGSAYGDMDRSILVALVWPPAPAWTRQLCVVINSDYSGYTPGGNHHSSSDTQLLVFSPQTAPFVETYADSCGLITPFDDTGSPAFAIAGSWWDHRSNEDGWWRYEGQQWINVYRPGESPPPAHEGHGGWALAQSDADGTRRLIAQTSAYMALTIEFDSVWSNPSMLRPLGVCRLLPGQSEVLLVFLSEVRRFFAYRAASGLLFDHTSILAGTPFEVRKIPGGRGELATLDAGSRVVRMYAAQAAALHDLTCTFAPASGQLRLRWQPVSECSGFEIFAATDAGSPGTRVAQLPATQLQFDTPVTDARRFYYLRVIYE